MPAPLGSVPTRRMPKVDVLGTDDSAATRAALRFFRDRRIVPRYVNLGGRPLTRDELRGLVDRLGIEGVADTDGRAWREAAADERPVTAADAVAWLRSDPRRLRLPIVRHGDRVTAGPAEATWRDWLARRG